jgi:hypothetical protein
MRLRFILALAWLAVCGGQAQTGLRDRYFARYPFDRWQAEGDRTGLRWIVRVHPAELTPHQRLAVRVEVEVDEKEVAKRRGQGELAALLQIEDASGHRWRTHAGFDLSRIPGDARPRALGYAQEAFLLPGDYKLSIAACDGPSGEYSFSTRPLHVAPLRGDALPGAWEGLPAVEFARPLDIPDRWFQPAIRGRVRLGVAATRPVHVDVVMNMTPSERVSGSVNAFRRNMSVLIPALKLLAAMDVQPGSIDVTMLDLTRQRLWEQKDARGLDWAKMRAPLAETDQGTIDVQSLAAKAQMAQFFRDRILERAAPRGDDASRVVIVLSAPAFLGQQLRLEAADLEPDPRRRIFYVRYRPTPLRSPFTAGTWGLAPQGMNAPRAMTALPADDLEHALRPLGARVLIAANPREFRKALAAMLAEIRRM